jgi:hypothetical protein
MMLGLLSLRLTQETEYFTEIAKRGHSYNIQVVRFTPTDINPSTELVTGLAFDHETQEWKSNSFPIPSFIYDRCFYNRSETARKANPIVDWLKKRPQTLFLGYGLPNKLQTYSILIRDKAVSPYIPASEEATADNVWKTLVIKKELIMKPTQGSQGNGLCYVSYGKNEIQVHLYQAKETKTFHFYTQNEFSAWLTKLLCHQSYIKQSFLSIQDRYGRPFDIRILLQKNGQGKWEEAGRGVRVGNKQSLVSNLNAGSQAISYNTWKQAYPYREIALLEDEISTLVQAVPAALEKELPPLFELGLDISFDRNRAVWLLDINSKPGRKVILESNPSRAEQLYSAPLVYCKTLVQSQKGADIK